jgi:hypothetical protein
MVSTPPSNMEELVAMFAHANKYSSENLEDRLLSSSLGLRSLFQEHEGVKPIHGLAHHGMWLTMDSLFSKQPPSPSDLSGSLHCAVAFAPTNSIHRTVGVLVFNGADIEEKDRNGETPLSLLMQREGHIANLDSILDHLANERVLREQDRFQVFPWQKALQFQKLDAVRWMIPRYLPEEFKAEDARGWTASHWIAASKCKKAIPLFRSFALSLEPNKSGISPEMLAKNHGWEHFLEDWSGRSVPKPVQENQKKPASQQFSLF